MIETVILTLLFAKWKQYDIKPLFLSKCFYPIFFFELLILFMQGNLFIHNYQYVYFAGSIKSIYMVLYMIPIIYYKLYQESLIGSFFILVGTMMNKVVMVANGGFMPVFPTISKLTGYFTPEMLELSPIHILATQDTKLFFLCDYIDIGYSILSLGDLLIRGFVAIVFFYSIKSMNTQMKEKNSLV